MSWNSMFFNNDAHKVVTVLEPFFNKHYLSQDHDLFKSFLNIAYELRTTVAREGAVGSKALKSFNPSAFDDEAIGEVHIGPITVHTTL